MGCCGGGDKNEGDSHAGHGTDGGHGEGGNNGQKGINWAQIVAIGIVILFLANIFIGR